MTLRENMGHASFHERTVIDLSAVLDLSSPQNRDGLWYPSVFPPQNPGFRGSSGDAPFLALNQ